MKWKNRKRLIIIGLFIGMAGCGNQSETLTPSVQQEYSDFFEVVEKDLTIDLTESDTIQGLQETIEKIDAADLGTYNAANSFRSTSLEDDQQSLFCIDPETGMVYFVNQNDDWFIYRIKEDSVEVVVELPARELSIWNGVLYFVVEDYDEYELTGIKDGDVYSYTPATGEVTFVYYAKEFENSLASHMIVNEKGINFVVSVKKEVVINDKTWTLLENEYYCLPFGSSEVIEDSNKTAFNGWNEYYLASPGGLKHRTDETAEDISLGLPAFRSFIVGDTYYSMDMEEENVYVKNLVSGEVKSYDCGATLEKYDRFINVREESDQNIETLNAFTITEDYIWVIASYVWLVRIEPESGAMECYRLAPEDVSYGVNRLYTDGQQIYALYSVGSVVDKGFLVQIKTEEIIARDSDYNNAPILAVEYLTK